MNDLYFMDYDTYHQTVGGSFLDYVLWMQSIKPDLLENFSKSSLEDTLEVVKKSDVDYEDTFNSIILFLLEFLGSHHGIVFDDTMNQDITKEQKIKEYLHLYQSAGMDSEHTIRIVKRYLKDLGRR